jgi:protein-disulfide isomerase
MRRGELRGRLLTILFVTFVAGVVAFFLIYPNIRPIGEIRSITPQANPMADKNSLGSPEAPVSVDVWEDFQCPACKSFSDNTKPQLVENYVATSKVRFTYHFFPFIDNGAASRESDHSSNAAMCAADQGRFWDYHDILFANWNGENAGAFSDRRLVGFAENLGLDMDAFGACVNGQKYDEMVQQDMKDGTNLGVASTPTILVNGVIVENPDGPRLVPQYEHIAAAIDAALAAAGQ